MTLADKKNLAAELATIGGSLDELIETVQGHEIDETNAHRAARIAKLGRVLLAAMAAIDKAHEALKEI